MARRPGFTLTEIIVSLVIVAVLAAMVMPTVFARVEAARVDAIVNEFTNLESGLRLFRSDVGRYPRRLDYLNQLPPSGSVKDACSVDISAANKAKYRGPYVNRAIPPIDEVDFPFYLLSTGDTVISTLTFAASFQGNRVIQIKINGPEADIAKAVDLKIDGVDAFNAGRLQYSDNGGSGANANMEKGLTYTIILPASPQC